MRSRLPDGASAISPEICVEKGMPLARMFAVDGRAPRRTPRSAWTCWSPSAAASIRSAAEASAPGDEWDATRKFSLAQGKASKGGTVQLQFTAKSGDSTIDGVYIDPRARH